MGYFVKTSIQIFILKSKLKKKTQTITFFIVKPSTFNSALRNWLGIQDFIAKIRFRIKGQRGVPH